MVYAAKGARKVHLIDVRFLAVPSACTVGMTDEAEVARLIWTARYEIVVSFWTLVAVFVLVRTIRCAPFWSQLSSIFSGVILGFWHHYEEGSCASHHTKYVWNSFPHNSVPGGQWHKVMI
jgi:hypothetical protein